MEVCDGLGPIANGTLNECANNLEAIKDVECQIYSLFNKGTYQRDCERIINANKSFNDQAYSKNKMDKLISNEDAIKHFEQHLKQLEDNSYNNPHSLEFLIEFDKLIQYQQELEEKEKKEKESVEHEFDA